MIHPDLLADISTYLPSISNEKYLKILADSG